MIEVSSCPVCESTERKDLFVLTDDEYHLPGEFPVVQCLQCGLGYLRRAPDWNELARYYPDHYLAYSSDYGLARRFLSRLVNLLAGEASGGFYGIPVPEQNGRATSTLDIGSGAGILTALLTRAGHRVTGIEMNRTAALRVAREGLRTIRANAAHPPFGPDSFDLIVGSQVFEHLYHPVRAMREYLALLRPGGTLVVAVPNFDSATIRTFGKCAFSSLSAPRHLVHFTRRSLELALTEAGFSSVTTKTTLFPSFLPSLMLRAGTTYERLCTPVARAVLSSLSLPLDFVLQRQGRGDGLVAIARKT